MPNIHINTHPHNHDDDALCDSPILLMVPSALECRLPYRLVRQTEYSLRREMSAKGSTAES